MPAVAEPPAPGRAAAPPALELLGISKRFGATVANDRVDFAVAPGEIRALVGENGAGKTTLMRIAYGLERADAGEIRVDGERRRFGGPLDAIAAGLGMVHQQFMLFDGLTVAENVVFAAEPRRLRLLDRSAAHRRVAELGAAHGLGADPARPLAELSVGERQQVEILKLLYRGARIVILDEPTAVLGPRQRDGLFAVLRRLAAGGAAVVLITHKLEEVFSLADRATVLRDGRVVATLRPAETTARELARQMVGREVSQARLSAAEPPGEPLLELDGVTVEAPGTGLRAASLTVRRGEVVGVAGAAGNGQRELARAIAGLAPVEAGKIRLRGRPLGTLTVGERRRLGLLHVPEDRDGDGLALAANVVDNLLLGREADPAFSRRGLVRRRAARREARALLERFAVKAAGVAAAAAELSGGNRQKLLLAREVARGGALLVAEQPTQGLDLGAAERVHAELDRFRRAGGGVLLVSSELAELQRLADRIVVLYRGRVAGELPGASADEASLGALMAGVVGGGES